MRRLAGRALLSAALAAATACSGSTAPTSRAPLKVTVQATPTFIGGPDVATFTLRVENTSASVVDLTFPSSCTVLPYFVNRITRQPVTPVGGGLACLTVITQLSLRPGDGVAQVVTVRTGDTPFPSALVLPPGDYAIYARLEDSVFRIQSEELGFSLR